MGLISLIVTVWLLIYASTVFSRHQGLRNEQLKLVSHGVTPATTIAVFNEASVATSPTDI